MFLTRTVAFSDLVILMKPRVATLVLATTAGGIWLAPGVPSFPLVILTLLGVLLLVGASSILNMYLERDTDALMKRTRNRPLPAKRMAPELALRLGIVLAGLGVFVLTFGVNPLTALLGVIAFIGYVLFYTPLKQKSAIAILIGAVPGAMPPLMGWTAATGTLHLPGDLPGLVLFAILFLWQIPHFLSIALRHQEDYRRAGIKVLPLEKGVPVTKHVIVRFLAALLAVSLCPAFIGMAGKFYLATALILGTIFFLWGCYGLRRQAGPRWAKGFFFASIIYLPILLAALVVDSMPS